MSPDATQTFEALPRGGLLVQTSAGPVQFGVPPETIKDTMNRPWGVPAVFILPRDLFSLEAGISLAELEFPIYYHFFFKRQKIKVVCTRPQQRRLSILLREALFGPARLDYQAEFANGAATPGYPDLGAEMMSFRTMPVNGRIRPLEMTDVVEYHIISQDRPVHLGPLSIFMDPDHTLVLKDSGLEKARFSPDTPLVPDKDRKSEPGEVFYPPLFGITTLGAGHGFAPEAMTSGLIIWVNRRGILVDPPVNSAPELAKLGVSPRILDSIILTHCHADHDAGTLQKIMQEGTITLYTTPTIFRSFIRKSAALTGIPKPMLKKAVRFVPLAIDAPVNINGGRFRFNYSLHSIPTISIQASLGGKSMVYSSDTHNDPVFVDQLFEKGVVSQSRRQMLNDFPWHRDLIFHEAGIPPLHTPMAFLMTLPEDVRKKLYLVHVTREQIPEGSGLNLAATGLWSTAELDVAPTEFCRAQEVMATYLDQPLFRDLPQEKAMEFLFIAQTLSFKPGEAIIRQGEAGHHVYLIMTGQVAVVKDGKDLTQFGRGDFFGEKCLFASRKRTASVKARTEVRLIAVHRKDFRNFIQSTPAMDILFHLSALQNQSLRRQLDLNPVFRTLTPSQKTELFQILTPVITDPALPVITENHPCPACFFVSSGQVLAKGKEGSEAHGPGSLLGTWALFNPKTLSSATYTPLPDTLLFRMETADLKRFAQANPGVYLKIYAHDH